MEEIIAKNLKELRNMHKLTQGEVADEIGVSDKTISKWELGGSTPNVEYLDKLSTLYGVKIDEIIHNTKFEIVETEEEAISKNQRSQQIIILSMIPVVFLFIAICIYVANSIIAKEGHPSLWIVFLWMVPISSLFTGLLVNRWWKICTTVIVLTSVFIWSTLLSFYVQFLCYPPYQSFWFIFLIGIPLQISIIILSKLRNKK